LVIKCPINTLLQNPCLILNYLVSLPFKILGEVGFNQKKMENSFVGKLTKALFYLVTLLAGLLTILEKLGYLSWFKTFVIHVYK